jgi:peptide deformylase
MIDITNDDSGKTLEMKPLDGVLKINTGDVANLGTATQTLEQVETFDLVPETDPILREVMPEFDFDNAVINPSDFASSLVETCKKFGGLGLSANQCGFPYRVFVMGSGDDYVAHFNPKVISTKGEAHMVEGCLSFPMLGFRITRPSEVVVEYQDHFGEKHTKEYHGISARCFLHELDHMNGVLYTDIVKPLAKKSGFDKRNKVMKKFVKYQQAMAKQAKQAEKKANVKNPFRAR